MTVETGTYIDSLNAQFPPETDALSEIDEHLKIIKSTIKNTFPGGSSNSDVGLTAPVTLSATELNKKTAIVSDGTNATFNTNITAAKIKTLVGISEPAITSGTDSNGDVVPSLATDISAAEVRTLIGASDVTLLTVYPVGAIYMSVSNTTLPGDLFGGTWASIGQGRMLVGFDDATENADTDFTTAEATNGSKTVTLSTNNLPAHDHNIVGDAQTSSLLSSGTQSLARRATNADSSDNHDYSLGSTSSAATLGKTSSVGSGAAVNNMPPYLVVYMWKRTA